MNAERRLSSREVADRRQQRDVRLVIPLELQGGWLALEATSSKVRVAPIPDGWMTLSDAELSRLVARQAAASTDD